MRRQGLVAVRLRGRQTKDRREAPRWDEAVRRARLEDAARENRELWRLAEEFERDMHSALRPAVFERRAEEEGRAVEAQNADAKRQGLVEEARNSEWMRAASRWVGPSNPDLQRPGQQPRTWPRQPKPRLLGHVCCWVRSRSLGHCLALIRLEARAHR